MPIKDLGKKLTSQKITQFMNEKSVTRTNKRRRTSDTSDTEVETANTNNNMAKTSDGTQTNEPVPGCSKAPENNIGIATPSFLANYKSSTKNNGTSLATQTPKTKQDWENLENCVDTFPAFSFQDDLDRDDTDILPSAREFWRDVRTAYDSYIRQGLRAAQLQKYHQEKVFPTWAYGWAPLPKYIQKVPVELIELKQKQAKDTMIALEKHLWAEARNSKSRAKAYQNLLKERYGEQEDGEGKYDLAEAEAKSNEVLNRDLKKYTKENDAFTEQQLALPRLEDTEIAKVLLKGPGQFSKLLSNFSSDPKKDDKKDRPRNKNAPYPKGKGARRGNNRN